MKILLRIFVTLIGILLLCVVAITITFNVLNKTNGSIISSGEMRKYLLYVPQSYDPAVPTPLIISVHGYAEWPAHQAQISRWNDLADEYGFIVVYPAGTRFPMRWSTSQSLEQYAALKEVQFISDLIDKLEVEFNIN
ncbi:MAG: hypothetical protein CVU39_14895 [Chloroflexi bacterium HGW-Chloroflexi-10]|nr:MAG: hypothetical protein CVU39_14895 [Chloroflexi bacterium HGW-Chloroflexi-10]